MRGWWRTGAVLSVAVLVVAGCGGDDGADEASGPTGSAGGDAGVATTVPAVEGPLRILVTNDDGVRAEGIDRLVVALTALDDVEVTVVAPLENQSGSADSTTDGDVGAEATTTASGYEAVGVDGFPGDAVTHALDDLGLEPHVVVSGVNDGTNIGPIEQISGTVGAGKVAARAGYPALALSQGMGTPPDYDVSVRYGVEWLEDNRDALVSGTAPVEVVSINGPTCPEGGEVAGVLEVDLADDFAGRDPLVIDCSRDGSTPPEADDDVGVYIEGWASLTVVDHEPDDDGTPPGGTGGAPGTGTDPGT